jgi:hypothetical protein
MLKNVYDLNCSLHRNHDYVDIISDTKFTGKHSYSASAN